MKQLTAAFGNRPSFPEDREQLEWDAKDFLELVWGKKYSEITDPRSSKPFGHPHPTLGDVNDAEWLLREARKELEFYPRPGELRDLHATKFPPTNGAKRCKTE